MPLVIGRHKWFRLLVLAIVLYLAFLPLWWYALDALVSLAASGADLLYHFFNPLVSIEPRGKSAIVTVVASEQSGFGGQTHSIDLRLDTVTYGLPMLAALVVVTHADSLRAKARALTMGLAAMIVLTVPAVMMGAAMASLQLADQTARAVLIRSGSRSEFFYYAFHGYAFSQPVIAVGIWMALMMLGLFKDKPKQQRAKQSGRVAARSRNALCPCGSGLKHKRCCGRA